MLRDGRKKVIVAYTEVRKASVECLLCIERSNTLSIELPSIPATKTLRPDSILRSSHSYVQRKPKVTLVKGILHAKLFITPTPTAADENWPVHTNKLKCNELSLLLNCTTYPVGFLQAAHVGNTMNPDINYFYFYRGSDRCRHRRHGRQSAPPSFAQAFLPRGPLPWK